VHFACAGTVRRRDPWVLHDDPFVRVAPAVILQVDPGLLGHVSPPPGPGIQRYSGLPWLLAGF
jgi:hypothetical protein